MKPAEKAVRWLLSRDWIASRVDRRIGPVEVDWPGPVKGFLGRVGFGDIFAVGPRGEKLFVQVTTKSNKASRIAKMRAAAHVIRRCQAASIAVELWLYSPDSDEPQRIKVDEDILNVLAVTNAGP